jgi:chromosome partitioning protein
MKIYSLANQKGGVGKTTTCLNLAMALSKIGKRVCVVDCDPQSNLSSGLGVNGSSGNIYDVFSQRKELDEIIREVNHNLFIVPSTFDLVGFETEVKEEEKKEKILKEKIIKTIKNFDYVLIDTPPSLGLLTLNALVASNSVIIPVQGEYYSLEGLTQLLKTIKKVKELLNPSLRIRGFLLTLFDRRLRLAHAVEAELRRVFKDKVFKTVVPRSVRLAEAPSFGKSVFDYAPNSKGALAYMELAKEILKGDEKKSSW